MEKDKKNGQDTSKGNGGDDSKKDVFEISFDSLPEEPEVEKSITPKEETISITPQEVKELKEQLENMIKERDELYDRLLRKLADFNNYRKRIEKEKEEFLQIANSNLIKELLPIMDNLERALSHFANKEDSFYVGIQQIYRQLKETLKKFGLVQIQAMGKQFDPSLHEAIAHEENNDIEENTILEEYQRGYLIHNKLLRPSLVKVCVHKLSSNEGAVRNKEADNNEESDRN